MSDPTLGASLRGAVDLSSLRNRPAPAVPGEEAPAGGDAIQVPSLVMDVTDETFPQVLELSRAVPVVIDLWAEWCGPCKQLSPVLERVVTELAGRVVLAKVDVDANPQLSQAFRAQSIPMVVALVAGQPVPLFTGAVPEQQVRDVFAQLLQLAAQNGVTGSVSVDGAPAEEPPAEPPMPPLHAEAFEAIEAGDYPRAIAAYEKALAENPRDAEARAGLGQVRLLDRVQGLDLASTRAAAAAAPGDVAAQFAVADLDLAGGHVDDAFGRLLDLFAQLPADQRTPVRERLLELFALVGDADPRVIAARGRLASLLF